MKIRSKILALVMSAALLLTLMPAMAFAEDGGAKVIEPVAVHYIGYFLQGTVGRTEPDDLYHPGQGFSVEYSDGSEIEFYYGERTIGEGKQAYTECEFFPETTYGDDFYLSAYSDNDKPFVRGDNTVALEVYPPYIVEDEGSRGTRPFRLEDIPVWCNYNEPIKIEFKPAGDFMVRGNIGENWIFEDSFYGEGNIFTVTYQYLGYNSESGKRDKLFEEDWDYMYFPYDEETGRDEGFYTFYDKGDEVIPLSDRFEVGFNNQFFLDKGISTVPMEYIEYVDGFEEPFIVNYDVQIDAERYQVSFNYPSFIYSGKKITKKQFAKKFEVRNSDNEVVPASDYSYNWKNVKNVGWYELSVKFKNTEDYPDEEVKTYFSISPETPVLKSVKGGKKSITVKWKKQSASQLKNVSGAFLEIATDKNFDSNYKIYQLSKKDFSKFSRTIKKLKANKKYYVRISTFKKVKNEYVFSADSKIKSAKTKK